MKEFLPTVVETLFEGKQKRSASTATRKTEILADDVLAQLAAAVQSAPCPSLAIDQSADGTDNGHIWSHFSPKAFIFF